MATAVTQASSDPTVASHDLDPPASVSVVSWSTPQYAAHPEAAEMIRQVEYYFGDENLPGDAHMLGLTGRDGTNSVSLSQILRFNKMRKFKPKTAVRKALKQSNLIEIVDSNHIRRKFPLTKPLSVQPKIDEERSKSAEALANNPGMTKNMLKPTGFEQGATDSPLTEEELDQYSPTNSFIDRIESAIKNFNNKRTMHQDIRAVFAKFMHFGGVEGGANMFQGGMTRDELKKKGHSKKEIDDMLQYYAVSSACQKAYFAAADDKYAAAEWVVDFEAIAKAYFSSEYLSSADWYDEKRVKMATQVLRSFYKYLLLHKVCPEYEDQLRAACNVCDDAENELTKLAVVDSSLPGAFDAACSTLFKGSYTGLHRDAFSAAPDDDDGGWITVGGNIGLSKEHASIIFNAGVAAFASGEQYEKAKDDSALKVISEQKIGLEVVGVYQPIDSKVEKMYADLKTEYYDFLDPMGKLVCKRWDIPYAAPSDLPAYLAKASVPDEALEFIVEAETLGYCYPGIKIEAVVKELDIGIKWIDSIDAAFPSFHTYLPNEHLCGKDAWKDPGEPKPWMQRQNDKKNERGLIKADMSNGGGENEATFSDEEPD